MVAEELPVVHVRLDHIQTEGGTQPRVEIKDEVVQRYSEHLNDLPPADVFYDGTTYWLADGFYRFRAHQRKKRPVMNCRKHLGTQRDAILFAAHSNSDAVHGVQLTDPDKWQICRMLLTDKEWSKWSDREIARQSGGNVSHPLVGKVRRALKEEAKKEREREKEAAKKAAEKAKKKEEEKKATERANTREGWTPPGQKVDGNVSNDAAEAEDVRQFKSKHGTTGTRKVKSERGAVRVETDPEKKAELDRQLARSPDKAARQAVRRGWDEERFIARCREAYRNVKVAT
jgi:hypothetical protein